MSQDRVIEKLEEIEEKLDQRITELEKTVKGGDQPSSKIKVLDDDGGPGHPVIAQIMGAAKKGGRYDGVEAGEVEALLEKQGLKRSRRSVLRLMRRIADEFPNYRFRKGKSRSGSELHYQPRKPSSTHTSSE